MRKYIKENDFCGHLCQYAEQTIDILKSEIDRLKAERDAIINGQETLQRRIAELLADNERLDEELQRQYEYEIERLEWLRDDLSDIDGVEEHER